MRFAEKLKAVYAYHKPTEYDERLIEDGTTNVACKLWIKPSTVSKVKTMKIGDREFRLKTTRKRGDDGDELKFFFERDAASEEWVFEVVFTLVDAANAHCFRPFIQFIADPGMKDMCMIPCSVSGDVDKATLFFHIECSLFLPLGELFCPEPDAALVCGEEELPVNRNYTSHFSKFLLDLYSKGSDDSKKFNVEVCTAEELKIFMIAITSLHPQSRPYSMGVLAAYREMSGAQSIFYGVEETEVDRNNISKFLNVFENVKYGQEQDLKLLSYVALKIIKIEDFEKNKESFDKLDEEAKKLCEERRVELEERKKEMEREETEMDEWKKKKENGFLKNFMQSVRSFFS